MPTHYIPDHVTVVCRPDISFQQGFTGRTIVTRPAFAAPSSSKKMIATARRWANRPGIGAVSEFTVSNAPMRNLQVVGAEHRSEGGMAFKVLTDHNFYVDLREPEFMEALLTGKIGKDGFIQGEYVWSVGGNQMRIVRVGSAIYNERLKLGATVVANGRARLKAIRPADLVVGNLYNTSLNGPVTYAGRVRRTSDRKLMFAWYEYIAPQNTLGRGAGTKSMIISSTSFALNDLGRGPNHGKNIPLTRVQDGLGQILFRGDFTWQNGDPIRPV